jgi:RNA polymerase sigma-70 factor (ECF subfamily)
MSNAGTPASDVEQGGGLTGVVLSLFEREGAGLFRLALRITGSREDARAVVSDSFAELARQSAQGPVAHPEAWLRRAVTQAAVDSRRRRFGDAERKREMVLALLAADAGGSGGVKGRGPAQEAEILAALHEGLERLSALDRALVLRAAPGDAPLSEVAEALGLTEQAARDRLSRARAFLKPWMRKAGRP